MVVVLSAGCGDGGDAAGGVRADDPDRRYEGSFTVLESPDHGPELCAVVAESLPPQCHGLPVVGWDWDDVEGEQVVAGTVWGAWQVTGTYDGERLSLTEPPGPARDDGVGGAAGDFSPACDEPAVVDPTHGMAEWQAMSDRTPLEDHGLVAAWVSDPGADWDGPFVGSVVVLPGEAAEVTALVREHYGGPLCVVERDAPTAAQLAAVHDELLDDATRAAVGPVQSVSTDERRGVVEATVWVADDAAIAYADRRWGDLVELQGLLQPA